MQGKLPFFYFRRKKTEKKAAENATCLSQNNLYKPDDLYI